MKHEDLDSSEVWQHDCPNLRGDGICAERKDADFKCPHCLINRTRCGGNPKRFYGKMDKEGWRKA